MEALLLQIQVGYASGQAANRFAIGPFGSHSLGTPLLGLPLGIGELGSATAAGRLPEKSLGLRTTEELVKRPSGPKVEPFAQFMRPIHTSWGLAKEKLRPSLLKAAVTRQSSGHSFQTLGPGLGMLGTKRNWYMRLRGGGKASHPLGPVCRQHDVTQQGRHVRLTTPRGLTTTIQTSALRANRCPHT